MCLQPRFRKYFARISCLPGSRVCKECSDLTRGFAQRALHLSVTFAMQRRGHVRPPVQVWATYVRTPVWQIQAAGWMRLQHALALRAASAIQRHVPVRSRLRLRARPLYVFSSFLIAYIYNFRSHIDFASHILWFTWIGLLFADAVF